MSGTNALIPLQAGKPTTPPPTMQDMMQGFQQGQQIAAAPMQAIGQAQQIQSNALAMKGQMALRSVFSDPANLDPATGLPTPAGMTKLMQIDPPMGMKLQENLQTLMNQRMAAHIQKFNFSDKVMDGFRQANTDAMRAGERVKAAGGSDEAADAASQEAYSQWYDPLAQGGQVGADQLKGIPPKFNKNTAPMTDKYFQEQDANRRLEKQGWQMAEDPAAIDPTTGKPTVYRVNPGTGEARTMDGQPYMPRGVQKIGTAPPAGSANAAKLAIIDDLRNNPAFANATPGQLAVEAERQLKIAQGTNSSPEQIHSMANMIASYQEAPLVNFALSKPQGQAIMAEVQRINPDYNQTFYNQFNNTMTKFGAGAEGNRIRFLNVAVQHLDVLSDAMDKLGNKDVNAINAVKNRMKQELGVDAPVEFDAVKHIVGTEIEKAVAGGIGAVADRDRLMDSLNRSNSPAQLKGVISEYKKLMAGQAMGLERQYVQGTPDTPLFRTGQFSFGAKLLPETQRQLGLLKPGSGQDTTGAAGAPGATAGGKASPTQKDIDYLTAHPDIAPRFDKTFGAGAAKKLLNGAPAAAPPAAAPAPAAASTGGYAVPAEHASDPDGTKYNGGKFVKRGNRIVPADAADKPRA